MDAISRARAAAAALDWKLAYQTLAAADASGELPASELPWLAELAYAAGDLDGTLVAWERIHADRVRDGNRLGAAEAAVRVAQHIIMDTGLLAPTRAWCVRAERFLDGEHANSTFAWLCVVRNYERLLSGDFEKAREWARRAIEVGSKFEPVAAAVGRCAEARSLVLEGNVDEGLRLLDESAAECFGGDLPPIPAGMIYCELVCGAHGIAQYDLAEQWTAAYERWNPNGAAGSMHGRCRLHRAEILRLRGALSEAETTALLACDELRPYMRRELGWPLTELGTIRLRRGDIDGAEATFREAHELAWDPHPGFALVRLARGDIAGAAAALQDALDHPIEVPSKERPPKTELRRVPLLDAKVEIAIAAGDLDGARAAAAELEQIAMRFKSKAFEAVAALAGARVTLSSGDAAAARTRFEKAIQLWNEVGAPYETCMARLGLADALGAVGQHERSAIELDAARNVLQRIGAAPPHAPAPASVVTSPPPAEATAKIEHVFRRDGETWLVAFAGQTARLRDLKGMRYLALLFAKPGGDIHVLELVARESGDARPEVHVGDAGAMLDAKAKETYRRRLAEIAEDIEEAQARGDYGRASQAEREREFIVRELSRAVGLGGRDRNASAASERARVAATRAVRQAIDRVREQVPALAAHLDRTIRTGTFFAYEPDPRAPVDWVLDA